MEAARVAHAAADAVGALSHGVPVERQLVVLLHTGAMPGEHQGYRGVVEGDFGDEITYNISKYRLYLVYLQNELISSAFHDSIPAIFPLLSNLDEYVE